ncbi:MAG: protoheme IX farnesyltransferase [candidate division Zixibacteria bacterium]|nr:protoheme IX farnesyltransferase [candidate division Zixibacteria bacterium]
MSLKIMLSQFGKYLNLTKPRVMTLVIVTGATALVMEGSFLSRPLEFVLVLLALYFSGGSANALNQYFERDLDARMSRTRNRRPLPKKQLSPAQALTFAIGIGITSVAIFIFWFNWLSALLALATILFYGLYYTLWLKPRTDLNIVIGGAAGAMAPLIAWAAASGTLAVTPAILFLIVFIWTPPHFWSLALYFKEDYRGVGLPMMPLVRGDNATYKQILVYTVALLAVSLSLILAGGGPLYLAVAVVLGALFLKKSINAKKRQLPRLSRALFGYSIVYLFGLFFTIVVDSLIF